MRTCFKQMPKIVNTRHQCWSAIHWCRVINIEAIVNKQPWREGYAWVFGGDMSLLTSIVMHQKKLFLVVIMKTEFLLIFKYIIMLYDAYTYYARIQTPHAHTLSDRETGIIFKVTYNYPNNRINKQFNGMIVRCCWRNWLAWGLAGPSPSFAWFVLFLRPVDWEMSSEERVSQSTVSCGKSKA